MDRRAEGRGIGEGGKMRSLRREQYAYKVVTAWSSGVLKAAVDLAQGYPISMRTAGTLQTLAFSLGKRETGHGALAAAIADWVLSKESGAPLGSFSQKERTAEKLLELLATRMRAEYLAADREAIAFADAIKVIGKAVERSAS